MQLRGDNFAPTEALACRYALERGTTDGAGGTAPDPAYLPATFVSVHEVLCAAPPVPAHISPISRQVLFGCVGHSYMHITMAVFLTCHLAEFNSGA